MEINMDAVINSGFINLFDGATSTNSPPSAATDGVRVPNNQHGKAVVIRLRHTTTAGDDSRTATLKLWGYCLGEQYHAEHATTPGQPVSDTAGWDDLEESYSLSAAEDGNVTAFVLENMTVYERLYCEVTAITGSGTSLGTAVAFTDDGMQ
jgi:hypothetical protein